MASLGANTVAATSTAGGLGGNTSAPSNLTQNMSSGTLLPATGPAQSFEPLYNAVCAQLKVTPLIVVENLVGSVPLGGAVSQAQFKSETNLNKNEQTVKESGDVSRDASNTPANTDNDTKRHAQGVRNMGPKIYVNDVTPAPAPVVTQPTSAVPTTGNGLSANTAAAVAAAAAAAAALANAQASQTPQKQIYVKNLILTKPLMESIFHNTLSVVNVTNVKLEHCLLNDESILPLLNCSWFKNLTRLSLCDNPGLTMKTYKVLLEPVLPAPQVVAPTPVPSKGSAAAAPPQPAIPNYGTQILALSLCQNGIDDETIIQISQSLSTNKTLKRLDLWNNRIGDKGIAALAEALRANSSLETLNLSKNQITDIGAKDFALALTKPPKPDIIMKEQHAESDEKEQHNPTVVSPNKDDKKDDKTKKPGQRKGSASHLTIENAHPTPSAGKDRDSTAAGSSNSAGKSSGAAAAAATNDAAQQKNAQTAAKKPVGKVGTNAPTTPQPPSNAQPAANPSLLSPPKKGAKSTTEDTHKLVDSQDALFTGTDGNGDPSNNTSKMDPEALKAAQINTTLKFISLSSNTLTNESVHLFLTALKSFDNEKVKSNLTLVNLQSNPFDAKDPSFVELQDLMNARIATVK